MGEILNLIESVSGGFPSYFCYIMYIELNLDHIDVIKINISELQIILLHFFMSNYL